jgi:hypothetical protein
MTTDNGQRLEENMRKLKVLYYNWVDFEDEQQRGGGVSVYASLTMNISR